MKDLFSTVMALALGLSVTSAQEEGYEIKGEMEALTDAKRIYLLYETGGQFFRDSTELEKGDFLFKGSVTQPTVGTLMLDHGDGVDGNAGDIRDIYLHNARIHVKGIDSLATAAVTGSKLNEDYQRYEEALATLKPRAWDLNNRYAAASEEERKAGGFDQEFEALRTAQQGILRDFINRNPESIISIVALERYSPGIPDADTVGPLFLGLSESVRNSVQGQAYARILDNIKRTAIGNPAPLFTQNDTEGIPVSLTDFRGRYVLIDFWASWCIPCREENPKIVKAYEAYKNKNFTILGVSLDRADRRDAWLKAIREDGLTWTQVSDLKWWENEVATLYAVREIPQNFLVNPNGIIVAKNLGGDELAVKLAELLD